MKHLKVRCGVLVLSVIVASVLCSSSLAHAKTITQGKCSPPAHAKTITQAKYVVLLTAKLGLGTYPLPEEATKILKSVYIVPKKGWQLEDEVACEVVDEVHVLAIKSSLNGLIRYDPEDIPPLIDSLSDRYRICPETGGISRSTAASPPPPIDSTLKATGGGKASASE
jgi:hypothetical protein